MIKIAQKTLLSLIVLGTIKSAFALDSGIQNLTDKTGATDDSKISCSGGTDYLSFKLFEVDAQKTAETNTQPSIPPQLFNAKLTRLKSTATASDVIAGTNKEITLKAGNGSYSLTLDTFGTNLGVKTAQTYSVQYQCLNDKGKPTKGSSILTKSGIESTNKILKNNRTAKHSITCAKDLINGNTSSLTVKLINKTAVPKESDTTDITPSTTISGNVTAQVVTAKTAKNTIGDTIDVQNINGNYDVMVNSPINKALSYRFEYNCLNTKNIQITTSPFKLVQDQ